jgi:single-stranded-DNA-specific exonuclease
VAQAALAVPPLLQRILAARQVLTDADRVLDFQHLHPPQLLKGIDAAVSLLMAQLPAQRRVLIVSDFDADGATSCVLAIRALRAMGFQNVDYIVPNRFEYGYGLTPEIVQLARGKVPDILITVDNGISSIEGVQVARALGMQVIITDHHLPGLELPPADAIVNPNQPGCGFPSKALAGVGVVFYVMAALRRLVCQSRDS